MVGQKVKPANFYNISLFWLLKGGKIHEHEKQYKGPFKIIKTYKNGNLKILISPTKAKIVHANRLKSAHLPEEQCEAQQEHN